jgi:hypothetical protein
MIQTDNIKKYVVDHLSTVAPVYFSEAEDNPPFPHIVYYFLAHTIQITGDNSYLKSRKKVVINIDIYAKENINELRDQVENTLLDFFKGTLRNEEDITSLEEDVIGYRFEWECSYLKTN